MSDPAISVRGLVCTLGGRRVLDGVDLDVDSAEFVSILGPNGAGKSTLLRCLVRILRPSAGDVSIGGRRLDLFSQRELARVIGYVPQADARYLPFRVREFVLMGRYPHLSPFSSIAPQDVRAADEAMRRTETFDFADRAMDTLSGGERQRVFIAAALAQGARILLLDEPATFLDYRHQVDVLGLLRRLNREQGVTMLYVTHDVNSVLRYSSHAVALKDGRVRFAGTPVELLQTGVIEGVYDAAFERITSPLSGDIVIRPVGPAP
jgi:iron complex transport system ATP-binding protein